MTEKFYHRQLNGDAMKQTDQDGSKSAVERLVSAPTPKEGEVVAVRYRDNWDGEGDISTILAYLREGVWYGDEGGRPLLQYVGDEIIEWWQLTPGSGHKLAH